MENVEHAPEVDSFYCKLKEEIAVLTEEVNQDKDGDRQDGFTLANLADGWVSYKGMSWGFALQKDPDSISMTFGPDWPFVGHKQILKAEQMGDLLIFVDAADTDRVFTTPRQLAKYGLESLAAKVHDQLTS